MARFARPPWQLPAAWIRAGAALSPYALTYETDKAVKRPLHASLRPRRPVQLASPEMVIDEAQRRRAERGQERSVVLAAYGCRSTWATGLWNTVGPPTVRSESGLSVAADK